MQNINTGYQPEFGLGAFFAGQNAANTQAANEEELARLFLANQRELSMQPLDIQRKQLEMPGLEYDAKLARAKAADPDYINKALQGYMGQMNSQIAAGRGALATEPGKTALTNVQQEAALKEAGLLNKLWGMKEGGATGGGIGLPIGGIQNKADGSSRRGDASWQVNVQDQIARDEAALALRRKEWESNPNYPTINMDIINLVQGIKKLKARAGQPVEEPVQVAAAPTPVSITIRLWQC